MFQVPGNAPSKKHIRVGDAASIVKPGDPIPGKVGKYYEAGQYAPSDAHVTAIKLQEMASAGLLPNTGLNIYNKKGEISEEKLRNLDFTKALRDYGISNYSKDLPPFALVGLLSVFKNLDEGIFNYLDIAAINWVADVQPAVNTLSLDDQVSKFSEVTDTYSRNMITGYSRNGASFNFVVFQPFFVYLSVPIVPAIKNVSSGLNLSTVSTIKTVGYMIYDRMQMTDKQKYAETLGVLGWKRKESIPRTEIALFRAAGAEIGVGRATKWFRDTRKPLISAISALGPKENFSELLLYYFVHRLYLEAKSKDYTTFMDELMQYINTI